jgi:hypothetical protein
MDVLSSSRSLSDLDFLVSKKKNPHNIDYLPRKGPTSGLQALYLDFLRLGAFSVSNSSNISKIY